MPQQGLASATKPAWDAHREAFGIQVARVVASNWQDHTVDLVTPNGAALGHVPIATPWAGTDYGDLSRPQFLQRDNADLVGLAARPDPTRDCHALVAFVKGLAITPIVIGFFYPVVSQMMLDGLQKITRHVGDTFQAVSMDGDIWLAFNSDGSYVGFHDNNPSPPIMHGVDYDRTSDPAVGRQHSFTAVLRDGTSFHMDGPTGNITHVAGQHLHQEAKQQLDLLGRVVTISGLPALYPGGVTGVVSAPATVDPAITVAHLTNNAAFDYQPPIVGIGPNGEGILTGWTYLAHGTAARVEIDPGGTLRTFAAPVGFVGDPITWNEIPVGAVPYIVPPPVPFVLAWSLLGDQFITWLCPETPDGPITFNRNEQDNPSGTAVLSLNGSPVTIPDAGSPLDVAEGDLLKFAVTGAGTTDENLLTLKAVPATLPDVALWFTVDPTTFPPVVTPP